MSTERPEALVAGIAARRAGVEMAANPHTPRTWERTAWSEGWLLAPDLHVPGADTCPACGCHCYEEGGCEMQRESGISTAVAAVVEYGSQPAILKALSDAYQKLAADVAAAHPRDLVANRKAFAGQEPTP